jgi:hypothetical protein
MGIKKISARAILNLELCEIVAMPLAVDDSE